MISMVACYRGGPGFKSRQGRELLILNLYRDLEILISPIKGCLQLRINQLLAMYQGVHIAYFSCMNVFTENKLFVRHCSNLRILAEIKKNV